MRFGVVFAEPQLQPLGAAADRTAPQQTARRRGDNAGNRDATRDDADIDGELIAAGEKFLGAVERIDQDEAPFEVAARRRSTLSSATTGMPGSRRETPSMITASEASSAAVDRREVVLDSPLHPRNEMASVAAARVSTMSVSASMSALGMLRGDFAASSHG